MSPRDLTRLHRSASERPHGTRAKYMAGCSCLPCRAANANYISARKMALAQGRGNDLISPYHAREHVLALQKRGLGTRRIAQVAGLDRSTIQKVLRNAEQIRRQVSDQIRAVTYSPADGARVAAEKTHRRIAVLVEEGYSKRALARRIGLAHPVSLRLGDQRVTRHTELRVAQLYRTLTT